MTRRPAGGADIPTRGLRVAMALYGDVTYDSRVLREAETLAQAGHSVTVYCLSGSAPEGVPFKVVARAPKGSSVLPDGSSPFLRASSPSIAALLTAFVIAVRIGCYSSQVSMKVKR